MIAGRQQLTVALGVVALVLALVPAAGLAHSGKLAAASTTPAPAPVPGTTTAAVQACTPAPVQADRTATFAAQMTTIAGAKTMQELFELQESTPADPGFADVSFPAGTAPGFGVWQSSAANISVLNDSQTVADLPAPASFRVIVHYRWLNARRHVLRAAKRTTGECKLPDERASLAVGAITRSAGGQAGTVDYSVVIRNEGATAAGPFGVSFSVAGEVPVLQTVSLLGAHARQQLTFSGPACSSGQSITVVADPGHLVDEAIGTQTTKTAAC